MFEEAQLYSPVTKDVSGKVVVHLGEDHPGFNDPAYPIEGRPTWTKPTRRS